MFTGLLITILVVTTIATAVGVGKVYVERRRQVGGRDLKALPGSSDKLLERTIADVRVGDVISYDGRDFLIEGVLSYDEGGHRWNAGRMVDGDDKYWLVVGMERSGSFLIRLMQDAPNIDIDGYPPETLLVGETRFNQDKRGTATITMKGETGLGRPNADGLETAERCRWWLYDTAGDEVVIVEQWGTDYRALRGGTIDASAVELMPGS